MFGFYVGIRVAARFSVWSMDEVKEFDWSRNLTVNQELKIRLINCEQERKKSSIHDC